MEGSCKKRSRDVIDIEDDDHGRVEEGRKEFKEPPAKRQEVEEDLAGEEDDPTKSLPEELGVFEFPWAWEELENDLNMHAGELEALYSSLFYSTVLGVGVVHDHLPGEAGLYDGLFPPSPVVFPGEKMEDEWWVTPEMEGWDCIHAGAKGIA